MDYAVIWKLNNTFTWTLPWRTLSVKSYGICAMFKSTESYYSRTTTQDIWYWLKTKGLNRWIFCLWVPITFSMHSVRGPNSGHFYLLAFSSDIVEQLSENVRAITPATSNITFRLLKMERQWKTKSVCELGTPTLHGLRNKGHHTDTDKNKTLRFYKTGLNLSNSLKRTFPLQGHPKLMLHCVLTDLT